MGLSDVPVDAGPYMVTRKGLSRVVISFAFLGKCFLCLVTYPTKGTVLHPHGH